MITRRKRFTGQWQLVTFGLCAVLLCGRQVRSQGNPPIQENDPLLAELQTDLVGRSYAKALVVLDKLLRSSSASYQLYDLRGVTLEKMGKYGEATSSYLQALKLQPTSQTVRINLALNYLRLEKYAEASREFRVLIEREGNTSPPPINPFQQAPVGPEVGKFARLMREEEIQYFSLAKLFLRYHLGEAAQMVLSVGLQVFPSSAPLCYAQGWTKESMGDFVEARRWFQKALALQSDYYECCLRLGYSYFDESNIDGAIKIYRECIRKNPDNYAGHYFLGMFLLREKVPRVEEAISELELALKLNPHSLDTRFQLGRAYASKGLNSEAVQEFLRVVRENPQNEDAQYRLAVAYKKLNQPEEARKHLERFQTLRAERDRRMRENQILTTPIEVARPALGDIANEVVAFYRNYTQDLARGKYDQIWQMLTEDSRDLYHQDPGRLREILSHLDPALLDRMERSSISGGKLVAGRIICDFNVVDGRRLPSLVLVQEDDKLRLDFAFDLSLAGLAYAGARTGQ
jgi:tetratricopeptide (TPR) repeat protein